MFYVAFICNFQGTAKALSLAAPTALVMKPTNGQAGQWDTRGESTQNRKFPGISNPWQGPQAGFSPSRRERSCQAKISMGNISKYDSQPQIQHLSIPTKCKSPSSHARINACSNSMEALLDALCCVAPKYHHAKKASNPSFELMP